MKVKHKPCKGTGKAKDFKGCKKPSLKRRYGLCMSCFAKWLLSTDEGKKQLERETIKVSDPKEKLNRELSEWRPKQKVLKKEVDVKKNKKLLQNEINKLARKIDLHFGYDCICCNKKFQGQIDGCHFHNVGGNENIRYNLHNIHAGRAYCNQYDSEHKARYPNGLIGRYGLEYFNMVKIELPKKYNYLGLKGNEIHEALTLARKLNRNFDKIKNNYKNSIELRNYCNNFIGIYK